jgi:hypothetical protein
MDEIMDESMDEIMDETPDFSSMKYRQLQKESTARGMPANKKTNVLLKNLQDYVKDPRATLRRIAQEPKRKRVTKAGWVDWKNHAAGEILEEDLEPGGWLYEDPDIDPEGAYEEYYKPFFAEFKDVLYEQF